MTEGEHNPIMLLGRTTDKLRSKSVRFSQAPSEPMILEAAQSIRSGCGHERVMVWEMRGAALPKALESENEQASKRAAKR